jgi:hypothetical protein
MISERNESGEKELFLLMFTNCFLANGKKNLDPLSQKTCHSLVH